MHQLIPLVATHVNGGSIQTVNARELHAFLDVKSEYFHWIKRRIEVYGFTQGLDYTDVIFGDGPMKTIDYFVSLDMAKQLAMVERTAKGKEARRYFIACEKIALAASAPPAATVAVRPTREAEFAFLSMAMEFFERLGTVSARDRLMLAEQARNLVVSGQRLLPAGDNTPAAERLWSLAERVAFLGIALSRNQAATHLPALGKYVAAEWRTRYPHAPRPTEARFVDGVVRPVGAYGDAEMGWVDIVIQNYLVRQELWSCIVEEA